MISGARRKARSRVNVGILGDGSIIGDKRSRRVRRRTGEAMAHRGLLGQAHYTVRIKTLVKALESHET